MSGTEIVRHISGPHATIELAPQAWALSQRLAGTDFVPQKLRDKPEQVLAVILAGAEVGISPMTSLQKIHNIQGRPAMAAELMRAIVLREGHDLWIEEQSSTRVIVGGKRRGSDRETKVAWTMDDAKRAKLDRKDNWQAYPAAMLLARATAALCRAVFPDVLAGISYTIEEIEDGDYIDLDALPMEPQPDGPAPAGTPARARRAATRGAVTPAQTEPDPTPPVQREEAPLPGEEDDVDDIVDAELVEDKRITEPDVEGYATRHGHGADNGPYDDTPDEYEGPDQRIEGSGPAYTGPQVIAMRCQARGITSREDKLEFCTRAIEREIESTKDLTNDEITVILEMLDNDAAFSALWPAEEPSSTQPPPEPEQPARRRRAPDPAPTEAAPPSPTREQVSTWTGEQWRALLVERGVKVTELLREASRLAREDGSAAPTSLDDVKGSGFEDLLLGFVEDLATQRNQG